MIFLQAVMMHTVEMDTSFLPEIKKQTIPNMNLQTVIHKPMQTGSVFQKVSM